MGLDGTGASPRVGSQATALAKLSVARFEADRFYYVTWAWAQ